MPRSAKTRWPSTFIRITATSANTPFQSVTAAPPPTFRVRFVPATALNESAAASQVDPAAAYTRMFVPTCATAGAGTVKLMRVQAAIKHAIDDSFIERFPGHVG